MLIVTTYKGYLIQYNSLIQVDLQTGEYEEVASDVTEESGVNAIGYNVLDNYLYGVATPSRNLIRISSAGEATVVATFTEADIGAAPNVGDIDGSGHYWFGSGGRTWHVVDLVPESATYGTVLDKGTADTFGLSLADWAYIPVAGEYLWSISPGDGTDTTLLRFSLDNKEWEVVERYGAITSGGFGALYGINNGTLFASNNGNGEIWAFDVLGNNEPYLASHGPRSSSNGGARCVTNMLV